MQLTEAEYVDAVSTLNRCGIEGEDLRTAFENVCRIAGDTNYTQWLAEIRALNEDQKLQKYGHNQVRLIRVLEAHA